MSFRYGAGTASYIGTAIDTLGDSTTGAECPKAKDGVLSHRRVLAWNRRLNPLFALALISAASVFGLTQSAAADGLDSLRAHLRFLREKPRSLPLTMPMLPMSHTEGTTSYAFAAPRSATGITLVVHGDRSAKVKLKRRKGPDGKKLKHQAWSSTKGSKRWTILSFDGLGLGQNAIRFEVKERGNGKSTETYDVSVMRATTPGSDAALTALALSKSSLTPTFVPDTKTYQAAVPYGVTGLEVTVMRKEAATIVRLRGTAADGSSLKVKAMAVSGLNVGRNTIELVTTAEDGKTTERYTVAVIRLAPSRDTKLTGLALAEGTGGFFGVSSENSILRPACNRKTASYEATVTATVSAVTMTISNPASMTHHQSGTASDGTPLAIRNTGMTLTMQGTTRKSVTFDGLQVGKNRIEIRVTAEDGMTTETYKVTVTRDGEP